MSKLRTLKTSFLFTKTTKKQPSQISILFIRPAIAREFCQLMTMPQSRSTTLTKIHSSTKTNHAYAPNPQSASPNSSFPLRKNSQWVLSFANSPSRSKESTQIGHMSVLDSQSKNTIQIQSMAIIHKMIMKTQQKPVVLEIFPRARLDLRILDLLRLSWVPRC